MTDQDGPHGRAGTWALPRAVVGDASTSGHHPLAGLAARPRLWLAAEAGPGRLLPWVPVAFGAGIAVYFAGDREPALAIAVCVALGLIAAAILGRAHAVLFAVALLGASAACGFALVTWRAGHVSHGVVAQPLFSVALSGFVEKREERERTDRFVLRVDKMAAARASAAVERVRLSVKKGTAPAVGTYVELRARLLPPLPPLRPGGYDFARDLYFQGIGGSGFVLGSIKTVAPPAPPDVWLRYAAAVQSMRDGIDQRIRQAIGGDARAIATALLTGRRDAVSTPVNDALFISGLGHVLSISGYHMAVVAGAVFFIVRALLALVPAFAARYPIKKWAALAALFAAAFYLLLSGAEVATQRSFLMTAIVLVGVMVDRRAITLRTLAVAALAVMVIAPEAVVHPSFQMSFAATMGLVVLVEQGLPRLLAAPDSSRAARAALWGGRELTVLILASLIAGLATTPYAAFHFHRVTPYGTLANLAAMPVVSVWVMPMGLFGLLAMPFGVDGIFWRSMEMGIDWMIAVAQWVAALPGAVGRVSAFGVGALLLMTAGMVLVALLRSPLRWGGIAVFVAGVAWAVMTPLPDIRIAADGESVAVRGADGRLHVMRNGRDPFAVSEWLAADADARLSTDKTLADAIACDRSGCVTRDARERIIALAREPSAFADDCSQGRLIVTAHQPPAECSALVIGRALLEARGALALRAVGEGFVIEAARPEGTNRPWAPLTGRRTASDSGSEPTPRRDPQSESEARAPAAEPDQPADE